MVRRRRHQAGAWHLAPLVPAALLRSTSFPWLHRNVSCRYANPDTLRDMNLSPAHHCTAWANTSEKALLCISMVQCLVFCTWRNTRILATTMSSTSPLLWKAKRTTRKVIACAKNHAIRRPNQSIQEQSPTLTSRSQVSQAEATVPAMITQVLRDMDELASPHRLLCLTRNFGFARPECGKHSAENQTLCTKRTRMHT